MAKIAEAPLAIVPVGTMRSGRTRPMMEKPVATSTLMSVTVEARRIRVSARGAMQPTRQSKGRLLLFQERSSSPCASSGQRCCRIDQLRGADAGIHDPLALDRVSGAE